jgi:hypothetical protein
MTTRERVNAMLHYQPVDEIPVVHEGFWVETLAKWVQEGHLTEDEVKNLYMDEVGDLVVNGPTERGIAKKLGFDDDVDVAIGAQKNSIWYDMPIYPSFGYDVIETYEDGSYKMRDSDGVYVRCKDGAQGIPSHLGYSLVDRESWESEYLPRLKWSDDRLDTALLDRLVKESDDRTSFMMMFCGSLYGKMRNYWGVEEVSCLLYEDPDLFKECMDTIADVFYENVKRLVKSGVKFDAGFYWEDICYNKGPLINPDAFREYTARNYRRTTDLLRSNGIDICVVDCDGYMEKLVPIWLENGVNTFFPLEYGTWEFDFGEIRKKYGREACGIGNVNKKIFAMDRAAIDKEIERIKRLIDMGGYVPSIDHQIPPDAEWDLVKYYTDKMHSIRV